MRKTMTACASAVFASVLWLGAFVGSATCSADLIHTTTTTLTLISGGDAAGLDGATFELVAIFDETGVYIDKFGFAALDDTSHTVTISGASVAASNGVFSDAIGLTAFPTFAGHFSDAGVLLTTTGGPIASYAIGYSGATTTATIGGPVAVTDFGLTPTSTFSMTALDGSTYDYFTAATITVMVVPVPEPSSFAFAGLLALGALKRRRARSSMA